MNSKEVALKIARSFKAYDYSSIQCQFPTDIADEVYRWGLENIPEEDLSPEEKGRETDIHVTIFYGLHNKDFTEARNILIGSGPIKIKLGPISLFEADSHDVVKIDIISSDLAKINRIIQNNMDNTQKYKEYRAHCTIAYVKKNTGNKFIGCKYFEGIEIIINSILFSGHDNRRTIINI